MLTGRGVAGQTKTLRLRFEFCIPLQRIDSFAFFPFVCGKGGFFVQKISKVVAIGNLKNVKVISVMALFAAISVIAGKYLAIPVGEYMRFSFENLPIILSGIVFGPICGLITGVVADIVGCVLVGYTINPIITAGAALIGFLSGFIFRIFPTTKIVAPLSFSLLSAHICGSVLLKSLGLSIYLGMPFEVTVIWRCLNYFIVSIAEFCVLFILLKNKGFNNQILRITGGKI